ncbi:MAG TPA: hypothetical protein VH183_15915 [Burkholderiaceae bacterium]|jgi:hypothetical protein|nr:hypothetical protein [Burkholderiaceae bacterium]
MTSSSHKADAPDDTSIPVLTERLTLPPLELDTTLPTEPEPPKAGRPGAPLALDTTLPLEPAPRAVASAPPPARPAPTRPAPAPAPVPAAVPVPAPSASAPPTSGTHWTRIELELRASMLQAIADALPQHIDAIVRNRMDDAIERLITQLVAETRLAVAASLHDIVDQAVRAELARLRTRRR